MAAHGEINLSFRRGSDVKERLIGAALFACAALSTLVTVGIVGVLVTESLSFFRAVSVVEFLTGTTWTPLFQDKNFGILPLTFKDPEDYSTIKQGDDVVVKDVKKLLAAGETEIPVQVGDQEILTEIDISERQREHLLAGGTLNLVRQQLAETA